MNEINIISIGEMILWDDIILKYLNTLNPSISTNPVLTYDFLSLKPDFYSNNVIVIGSSRKKEEVIALTSFVDDKIFTGLVTEKHSNLSNMGYIQAYRAISFVTQDRIRRAKQGDHRYFHTSLALRKYEVKSKEIGRLDKLL